MTAKEKAKTDEEILKEKEDELLECVLNLFARDNQYPNWKSVLNDKQTFSFTAKEFEDIIRELVGGFQSSFQSSREGYIKKEDVLKIIDEFYNRLRQDYKHEIEYKGDFYDIKYFSKLDLSKLKQKIEKLGEEKK